MSPNAPLGIPSGPRVSESDEADTSVFGRYWRTRAARPPEGLGPETPGRTTRGRDGAEGARDGAEGEDDEDEDDVGGRERRHKCHPQDPGTRTLG